MKRIYGLLITIIILFGINNVNAQYTRDVDSTKYLLNNLRIQIEATTALNALYDFDFKTADKEFAWLRYKYPEHPMPYFLLGFSEWWKTVPYENTNREHDKRIVGYLDSCITKSKTLLKEDEKNLDAIFFMSASYGFLARIYSDQKSYRKATFAGRNALKYLEMSKEYLEMSPEFLFGDGLINYYTEWIKENYVMLRPILMFFPDGDKDLGRQQLEEASNSAFYVRTEAQYWLMYIYAREEYDYDKAFPIAEYLSNTFPNNAYFARYYAQLCWSKGKYEECEVVSKRILEGIDQGKEGYEEIGGRYASFYMAFISRAVKRDSAQAKVYYKKCIEFAEAIKAYDSGYYKYSHIYLARFAVKEGDVATAKKHYKRYVKVESNRKDAKYKEAKKYLKAQS